MGTNIHTVGLTEFSVLFRGGIDHFPQSIFELSQKYPGKALKLGPAVILCDSRDVGWLLFNGLRGPGTMSYLLEPLFGPNSVLITDGEQWQQVRRPINGLSSSKMVDSLETAMRKHATVAFLEWEYTLKMGFNVSVFETIQAITGNIVMSTLFSNLEATNIDFPEIMEYLSTALFLLAKSGLGPIASLVMPKQAEIFNRLHTPIRSKLLRIVEERRNAKKSEVPDFLDHLLEGLADNGSVVDNLLTLASAGTDTTASVLLTCVYRVAADSKLQNQIRQNDVPDNLVDWALQSVVPGWIVPRGMPELAKGQTLPSGLYLKKGTKVLPSPFLAKMDELQIHSMDECVAYLMRPEMEVSAKQHFGFSIGPKKCPGEKFARSEIKIVLKTLVDMYKFDLAGNAKPELTYDSVMRLKDFSIKSRKV